MNKKNYNVEVLVNGRKAQEFQKDGMTFVRGDEGTSYQIRVTNNSNRRILARITVDGRSVLTDDKEDESGYVINANDSLKLKGFRLSDDEVSQFVFSRKGDSRAQKRFGYAKDCGVIGVQILREKEDTFRNLLNSLERLNDKRKNDPVYPYPDPHPWNPPYPMWSHYDTGTGTNPHLFGSTLCSNKATLDVGEQTRCASTENVYSSVVKSASLEEPDLDAGAFDMGTSMGDNVKAPIERVEFETENSVDATFELYYASFDSLRRNNIIEKPKAKAYIPKPNYCKKV